MALPLANGFEGGTDTTIITAANSGAASGNAFDVVASSPTFSATHAMHGSFGAQHPATSCSMQWNTASVGTPVTVWGRVYIFFTANPTGLLACARGFTPTSATLASHNVRIGLTGGLSNVCKSGTIRTSATTMSLSTWYRVEYKFVSSITTCTLDCTLYLGDSLTALETMTQATGTGVSTDTSINQLWTGSANSVAAATTWFDDVQVNSDGFPGPSPIGPSIRPRIIIPRQSPKPPRFPLTGSR